MSVVNLPPMLKTIIGELEKRVRKLEQSVTFQAPTSSADPSVLRDGMIWYRTDIDQFKVYQNGIVTSLIEGTEGAWVSYVPVLGGTGWAIGNGTAIGAYCQIGKVVHFRARIVFGSTSTAGASASPTLTIPVASAGAGSVWPITGRILDASTSFIYLIGWQPVSTTVCQLNTIGTNGLQGQINSATPFTWTVSDELMLTGTYEAA